MAGKFIPETANRFVHTFLVPMLVDTTMVYYNNSVTQRYLTSYLLV